MVYVVGAVASVRNTNEGIRAGSVVLSCVACPHWQIYAVFDAADPDLAAAHRRRPPASGASPYASCASCEQHNALSIPLRLRRALISAVFDVSPVLSGVSASTRFDLAVGLMRPAHLRCFDLLDVFNNVLARARHGCDVPAWAQFRLLKISWSPLRCAQRSVPPSTFWPTSPRRFDASGLSSKFRVDFSQSPHRCDVLHRAGYLLPVASAFTEDVSPHCRDPPRIPPPRRHFDSSFGDPVTGVIPARVLCYIRSDTSFGRPATTLIGSTGPRHPVCNTSSVRAALKKIEAGFGGPASELPRVGDIDVCRHSNFFNAPLENVPGDLG
ncbi:hypothetical protein B0H15DRAFT_803185 [Mycena belliarum]|uniref:Uncharacterized protein n=1 Tax=Mycena belliarum TaxID=1033014 RepID=A0AAD6U2Q5_9AGAR|nr:hypothetical protein B0H15DRAFT_803185 [Mycena belliae]